jgi:hypothetical protein
MLELEPPRHTRLRGLVLRAFTARRIAGAGARDRGAGAWADRPLPRGPVDLLPAFAQPIPVIVIARLLGVPEADADQLLAGRTPWSPCTRPAAAARSRRTRRGGARVRDFLRPHVAERRARPARRPDHRPDRAEAEGEQLSPDELIATCDPAAERRARGDGARAWQRHRRLLEAGHRATGRRPKRRWRRRCASTRRCTCSPAGPMRGASSTAMASRPATEVGLLLGRGGTATPPPSDRPASSTPPAPPAPMWPSGAGSTSDRRRPPRPAGDGASRFRRCSRRCPRLRLAEAAANTPTSTISTGCRRSGCRAWNWD